MELKELEKIDIIQKTKFDFEENFMTPETYYNKEQKRIEDFKKKWQSVKIFEWHLAGQRAYNKINGIKNVTNE